MKSEEEKHNFEGVPANVSTLTPEKEASRRANRVLLVLVAAALLINYVETMIIPGVPTIQKYFDTTATIASWITSSYLIVGSAVSPIFGKLGDVYGKKKMFLISLIFYMAGVSIAGFSQSIYVLIFARGLQGVGFAIIPLGLAIVTEVFPREKVATAQGIISATFAIGAAAGLTIGSYVVQDFGWQYAFHSALVLSLVLFFVTIKVLRKDVVSAIKKGIDYIGATMLMAGIVLILLYVTEGPSLGWLSLEEIFLLVPGLILTVSFFYFESKIENPLMRLDLLKVRNVLVANIIGIISGITMFLMFFAIVYYAQLPTGFGLGLGILAAGLTLAPSTVGMMVAGPTAGRILSRVGPRPVLLMGSGLMGAGFILLFFNRATAIEVTLDMVLALAGMVCIIVPIVNMIAVSVPRESIAVGMGMNVMLRNLGGAIGPVLATSIMASYTARFVLTVQGHTITQQLPSSTAFNLIFTLALALTIAVAVISFAIKNYTFAKSV